VPLEINLTKKLPTISEVPFNLKYIDRARGDAGSNVRSISLASFEKISEIEDRTNNQYQIDKDD